MEKKALLFFSHPSIVLWDNLNLSIYCSVCKKRLQYDRSPSLVFVLCGQNMIRKLLHSNLYEEPGYNEKLVLTIIKKIRL
jgi:hypothetical protein